MAYGVITPFTSFIGGTPVGIENEEEFDNQPTAVSSFELLGNYPNPFNPSTTIRVGINSQYIGPLYIRIYNSLGQLVRTLIIQVRGSGIYEVVWDGRLFDGSVAASGSYFYIVEIGDTILAGKMSLLK